MQMDPHPSHLSQVYRAILHQDSMTWQNTGKCSSDLPCYQAQLYRALLHLQTSGGQKQYYI